MKNYHMYKKNNFVVIFDILRVCECMICVFKMKTRMGSLFIVTNIYIRRVCFLLRLITRIF